MKKPQTVAIGPAIVSGGKGLGGVSLSFPPVAGILVRIRVEDDRASRNERKSIATRSLTLPKCGD